MNAPIGIEQVAPYDIAAPHSFDVDKKPAPLSVRALIGFPLTNWPFIFWSLSLRMHRAVIGLGSNRGSRWQHLVEGLRELDRHPAISVVEGSPVYESAAHTLTPEETQPAYLNAVARLHTSLAPEPLVDVLLDAERALGRRPDTRRWAPRTLDLDLLAVGGHTCRSAACTVPHPRLGERRFVLRPWADLAPNQRVPAPFNATVAELLAQCADTHPLAPYGRRLSFSS